MRRLGLAVGEGAEALGEIVGEFDFVAAADIETRRRLARLDIAGGDAGETLADIEGEIRLADLAIVDAVDADVRLLANDIGDDVFHLAGEAPWHRPARPRHSRRGAWSRPRAAATCRHA